MTVRDDILTKLTMDPIPKITRELGQRDLKILEAEAAVHLAKIKTVSFFHTRKNTVPLCDR